MEKDSSEKILRVAQYAASVDGNRLADRVEWELEVSRDRGEVTAAYEVEERAISAVLRELGPAIHPLEWTLEELSVRQIVRWIAEEKGMRARELAMRVLIWIADAAACQIHDLLKGSGVEEAFLHDVDDDDIALAQLHMVERITKLLHDHMKIPGPDCL